MATFTVPVSVLVEAASQEAATAQAKSINELLGDSMVRTVLAGSGVVLKKIVVFQPIAGAPRLSGPS